eukprot:CAMPEP_0172503072 /NCGR_PEP_ID=MMETSP1066-20121228/165756_1 /TAXON_ID=671091 /ORGANISM="Coscinodiscus wailesii, Strain CCMP2513" /LENGTH=717 /DNA_ID=CAMNT_0013278641 /DNA_START=272 /DNA_END=2425 /DNA_ORIENTATION=+
MNVGASASKTDNDNKNNNDNNVETDGACRVCRVVASGDGKLPRTGSALLSKIDSIYHAQSHTKASRLKYLDPNGGKRKYNKADEEELIPVLRKSLNDAGFRLLNRRDLDLCEALNAGYFFRLSILPDTRKLDPDIGKEFYPELSDLDESLLFDGRVLVFRRGYDSEATKGRLLLPKLDYLQASIVQRSASKLSNVAFDIEQAISDKVGKTSKSISRVMKSIASDVIDNIPDQSVVKTIQLRLNMTKTRQPDIGKNDTIAQGNKRDKFLKLRRYGGSKFSFVGTPDLTNALEPFTLCYEDIKRSTNDVLGVSTDNMTNATNASFRKAGNLDQLIHSGLESGEYLCEYDETNRNEAPDSFQLLERVSISNLIDIFSRKGRREMVQTFLSESELVEPTYEEVMVIWRPMPKKRKRPKFTVSRLIPKFVYDVAEIFFVEDRLPSQPPKTAPAKKEPFEIRIFKRVPMGNIPAVLPKTRLVFRPADAFVFDSISLVSLVTLLLSQRFDNPRLDLIALVSISVWVLRTVIRYSNKLARYDLLVKNFLTSKMAQRGAAALRYIISQGGSQRAVRADIVHNLILSVWKTFSLGVGVNTEINGDNDVGSKSTSSSASVLPKDKLISEGNDKINSLFVGQQRLNIDIEAALSDLENINLIKCSDDGKNIETVRDGIEATNALRRKWISLYDDDGTADNMSTNESLVRYNAQESLMTGEDYLPNNVFE